MSMRELTFAQAIREALDQEMAQDERIIVLGEDVGAWGGVFRTTEGLFQKYGPDRVIDTPLSEEGFVGMAVGAAMTGMHPVPEIMFGDFITLVMDQLVNQAAKMRYMTGGQVQVPLTVRATMGGGRSSGAQHSQSWHAWFAHVPGLKVVVPSTPYDAKGLLTTALRDPNPTLFFEDKVMYTKVKGEVPETEYAIPFGVADIKRAGTDVTVIALSRMVHTALTAAEKLAADGISVEVIDPRTLNPLDKDTIIESVVKTGGAVIVDEGYENFGVTAELAAIVAYGAFDHLDAPVERVGAMNVPIPFTPNLEFATIPDEDKVISAVQRVMQGRKRVWTQKS